MEFASALPFILILFILAFCIYTKPNMTAKNMGDYFASANNQKIFPKKNRKRNRGAGVFSVILMILCAAAFFMAIAPVDILVGVSDDLWSMSTGKRIMTEEIVWLPRISLILISILALVALSMVEQNPHDRL